MAKPPVVRMSSVAPAATVRFFTDGATSRIGPLGVPAGMTASSPAVGGAPPLQLPASLQLAFAAPVQVRSDDAAAHVTTAELVALVWPEPSGGLVPDRPIVS